MKKAILTYTICITVLFANAQPSKEAADFNTYTATMDNNRHQASQAKDYAKAIAIINEWLAQYDKLPPASKQYVSGYTQNMYYNMACYKVLTGDKAAAIDWLKKAFTAGYIDYAFALSDSDLSSLHDEQGFKALIVEMREKGDYGYILKNSGPYDPKQKTELPAFSYQSASAPELVAFKNKYNLDSISGNGDEISKFKKLLYWVHNTVRHDGNSDNPPDRNGTQLIEVCKKENRGVNCRMLATILKDAYEAEGFKTRLVTCMPKDTADFDCHVITVVWSKSLNKWIWMDPTFCAYVSDEKGNLLNIEEVRERLVNGSAVVLNEDANWNNKMKETKEAYFRYMSKNLFWLKCSLKNDWGLETAKAGKPAVEYINLYPGNYNTLHQAKKSGNGTTFYATNNPGYFWQKPEGE
jgi:hypothetical protein